MKIAFAAASALAIAAAPALAQDMDYDTDTDVELDGSELEGESFKVRTSAGMEEDYDFDRDGVVRIRSTNGIERQANYRVDSDRLCIDEDDDDMDRCYSYTTQFQQGQTYRLTDTNGVISDFTMDYDRDTDRRYLSASYGERG